MRKVKIRRETAKQTLSEREIARIKQQAYKEGFLKGHAEGALVHGAEELERTVSYQPRPVPGIRTVHVAPDVGDPSQYSGPVGGYTNGASYQRRMVQIVEVRITTHELRLVIRVVFRVNRAVDGKGKSYGMGMDIQLEALYDGEFIPFAFEAVRLLTLYIDALYAIEIVSELFAVGLRRYIKSNANRDYNWIRSVLIGHVFKNDEVPEN